MHDFTFLYGENSTKDTFRDNAFDTLRDKG